MKKFIVEPEFHNMKISQYLREKGYSGRGIRNVEVYLNGKRTKTTKQVKKNARLLVKEKEKEVGIRSIQMDLKIMYEDKNLLIIDKDPYLVVHPTTKKTDLTLANGVIYYLQEQTGKIQPPRFFNRLDMNTSGLIVVAKNAYTQAFLQSDKEKVSKFYQAIVKGIVKDDEMMIEIPIGKEGDELRRKEMSPEEGGQTAKTHMKVLERFPNEDLTLIQLELFTGRTHQIRAHMSLVGHPILGDELYGGDDTRAKRQLLHAFKLIFTDVESGQKIEVQAPLPDDFKEILHIAN
ncbi:MULTISPECIES: RluA family pseudouridine synthase [Cetobacterium]|jgi:23S rRNA pseudouridine1911/1915/1917 synthase|uniref:Pseudouridine synthase n=1 Tax=Candidatus Cetobacterium colombiensis TaxID=3073100 RepID=A0ABU4WAY1_9FUSO|nr:RluA family pseudouridine synthase [Candidatus Cetobacterium colombiensis]MDX8336708.1 RluA family pseudouridine synthase [Candidatus Cetobacterium colombiensis]